MVVCYLFNKVELKVFLVMLRDDIVVDVIVVLSLFRFGNKVGCWLCECWYLFKLEYCYGCKLLFLGLSWGFRVFEWNFLRIIV